MESEKDLVGPNGQAQPTEGAAGGETEPKTAPELEGKAAKKAQGQESGARPAELESLKPGMQFRGKVRNVVDFGAFIDIGVGRDGLAHVSTLKKAGLDKALHVGDEIDVIVRRVDLDSNRISLAIPDAEGGDNKTSLRDLKIGSVVMGHVVRLADFGAFVDVGAQTDGLLHVSQLPWGYVNHPSEVLHVGDEVQVRILEVDSRKRRISLSMREVGTEAAAESAADQAEDEGENRAPTAFEIAFAKARAKQRRRPRA